MKVSTLIMTTPRVRVGLPIAHITTKGRPLNDQQEKENILQLGVTGFFPKASKGFFQALRSPTVTGDEAPRVELQNPILCLANTFLTLPSVANLLPDDDAPWQKRARESDRRPPATKGGRFEGLFFQTYRLLPLHDLRPIVGIDLFFLKPLLTVRPQALLREKEDGQAYKQSDRHRNLFLATLQ